MDMNKWNLTSEFVKFFMTWDLGTGRFACLRHFTQHVSSRETALASPAGCIAVGFMSGQIDMLRSVEQGAA
jgi:hypothetical protein